MCAYSGCLKSLQALRKRFPDLKANLRVSWMAARGGSTEVTRMLIKEWQCPLDASTSAYAAAATGNVGLVSLLHDAKCKFNRWTCEAAAEHGHLKVLQFAHRQARCSWTTVAFNRAAAGGHRQVMDYLHKMGCPWAIRFPHESENDIYVPKKK